MFRMLTCFNLKPDVSIDEFHRAIDDLNTRLIELDLIDSVSPIGKRQKDTIMDTDEERDQEFFFIMNFRDRAQCDRAIVHMYSSDVPTESAHANVQMMISDEIFICWQDL